jgi:hypothetical protein
VNRRRRSRRRIRRRRRRRRKRKRKKEDLKRIKIIDWRAKVEDRQNCWTDQDPPSDVESKEEEEDCDKVVSQVHW